MTQHDEAVRIARLFTAAVEKSMVTSKLGSGEDSLHRNHARHEAVAQYLLDHILRIEGELDRLLHMLEIRIEHYPELYSEWKDPASGRRFDHVVDDRYDETEWTSVLLIEDKIDAPLGVGQLHNYCKYLSNMGRKTTLLVLHPMRNPLSAGKAEAETLRKEFPSVAIEFRTWSELVQEMIEVAPDRPEAVLWRALKEYTESVGTGDLELLPDASVLLDPAVSGEIRDAFLSAQGVAAKLKGGKSGQLRFSLHGGNAVPWLQMGMSDTKSDSVGLEFDLIGSAEPLLVGVRGPSEPESYLTSAKIGVFRDGRLSAPAQERAAALKELDRGVRSGTMEFPDRLSGRRAGELLSPGAQEALFLLGSIFQAQALKNPYRGGAPGRGTTGFNEGAGNERIGAVLAAGNDKDARSIHLFIGPPDGAPWERCTVWIREDGVEREIEVRPGEPGRDYVLRVWSATREALQGR